MRRLYSLLAAICVAVSIVTPSSHARDKVILNERQEKAQADYLQRLVFYEQRLNDRVENLNQFATIKDVNIDRAFTPESRAPFKLWTVLVPVSELTIINTTDYELDSRFMVEKDGVRYIKMPVHPVSRNAFLEHLPEDKYQWAQELEAMALASYRSLVAWESNKPANPFQVKVSLDAIIGANSRMLSHRQIERAATSSYILKSIDRRYYASRGILFMDEPVGIYLNKFKFGFALRETPILDQGVDYIPMFSLYARPGGRPSLLSKMIANSGLSARDYILHKIIKPMIQQTAIMAFEDGIVMEAHEQNSMAEVANGQLTGRFVYRDLGGFSINREMRAANGKDMSFLPHGFDPASLAAGRGKFVEHVNTYLGDSNFYALRKAVEAELPTVTQGFITDSIRNVLTTEIYQRTGHWATSPAAMAAAITKYTEKQRSNVRKAANAPNYLIEDTYPNCLYLLDPALTKDAL